MNKDHIENIKILVERETLVHGLTDFLRIFLVNSIGEKIGCIGFIELESMEYIGIPIGQALFKTFNLETNFTINFSEDSGWEKIERKK